MFNTSKIVGKPRPNEEPGPSQAPSTSKALLPAPSVADASFLTIPVEVRQLIYNCLSYDDTSKIRLVCRTVGNEAWSNLNKGFKEFNAQLERERHQLKRELPRRESDRRKHRLFPYSEMIASLETRRDLLEISYRKYVEKDVACFIPGKVLDEGFRLLRHLRANKCERKAFDHELFKDFRDLSSMAIDHFEECIAPNLRKKTDSYFSNLLSLKRSNFVSTSQSLLNRILPLKSDANRAGANYLQQRIAAQDATIKKQSQKIEHLRAATGLLISAVEQLSDYVGLSIPTTPLREILMADEAPEDQPSGSNDTFPDFLGGLGNGGIFGGGEPAGSNNEPIPPGAEDSRKRKLAPHPEATGPKR